MNMPAADGAHEFVVAPELAAGAECLRAGTGRRAE